MKWYIGCSGFHYMHWKHLFYPDDLPQKKWFEYYCGHFNAMELNVTFYHFPRLEVLKSWQKRSPAGFVFAVKAPRLITQFKQFIDIKSLLDDFYSVSKKGLKKKLGCLLFQFPPRFNFTEERLLRITSSLDTGFINVVEFRHPSWWQQNIYDALAEKNISFSGISHPTLPQTVIKNTKAVYYRFHGLQSLYSSMYQKRTLRKIAKEISEGEKSSEVFIFFNNDSHAAAVKNAKEMQLVVKK